MDHKTRTTIFYLTGPRSAPVRVLKIFLVRGPPWSAFSKISLIRVRISLSARTNFSVRESLIATSDYTALFLVHQCMVRKAKQTEPAKQLNENRNLSEKWIDFADRFMEIVHIPDPNFEEILEEILNLYPIPSIF